MESQQLFDYAVTGGAFLAGWIVNNIYKAVKSLEDEMKDFPHTYVMKEDYKTDIAEVKQMLNKIFDLLGQKADK
jgi:cell shape-determining protein MreC